LWFGFLHETEISKLEQSTPDQGLSVIRAFDNLPLERKMLIFRDLSPKARIELLASVSHPERLVRLMSPEEVFVGIKQVGEEDAMPLIALTTGKQVSYILDVELWEKEEIDMEAAGKWFEILTRISDGKVLQFFQVSDPELILTSLSRFIRVKSRNPEIDQMEQRDSLPVFTLDDTFFIDFVSPRWEDPIRRVLEAIYDWDPGYYFRLMEEICWGVAPENEQSALHWRRARLADHGFPEFDEAFEIYRHLHREAVSEGRVLPDQTEPVGEQGRLLRYPMRLLPDQSLFRECLDSIPDDAEKDRLAVLLAHLANKVMIADSLDPGSMDDLHGSLTKVGGYINIALEEVCPGDVPRGIEVVLANHPETLFRRGYSIILDLRREATDKLKEANTTPEDMGHPLSGLLDGLFHKRPFFAANYLGGDKARDFASMADIRCIREAVRSTDLAEGWEPV
jgi:hypothetical protein